jgi:signal transduction histidine kinase
MLVITVAVVALIVLAGLAGTAWATVAELRHQLAEARAVERTTLAAHAALVVQSDGQVAELTTARTELVTEREGYKRLELELREARKLEEIGRLATGIAHELVAPVQTIDECLHVLRACFSGEAIPDRDATNPGDDAIPEALAQAARSLDKIAGLARSVRAVAQPEQRPKVAADLNRALAATLTLARNEYRHVADVEIDYGELPPVPCSVAELNQAFLNLVVAAARAITIKVKGTANRGRIAIATRLDGDHIELSIHDSGAAGPRDHGIAGSVIDRHGGSMVVIAEPGGGTTVVIRLPIQPRPGLRSAA